MASLSLYKLNQTPKRNGSNNLSEEMMRYEEILRKLKSLADPEARAKLARFGIKTKNIVYGVPAPALEKLVKEIGRNHALAQRLWKSGIMDAQAIAVSIDDPKLVSEEQMEVWVKDFDSWAICDATCNHLFRKTSLAYQKAEEWSKRDEEYVKRAGFVLMATLAVHDKKAADETFIKFLPIIKQEATDERNFVKKAVNWALRQIGKRNLNLNKKAIEIALEIKRINSRAARWIASNALRELTSDKVQKRLSRR